METAPKALRALLKEKPEAKVWLVGGAVRDGLLGRTPQDSDYVVGGVPAAELRSFLEERGRVDEVGRTFGVFKFRPKSGVSSQVSGVGADIDVALPRKDFSAGTGGYRDVETQSDPEMPIEDDLSRRDFTVNAMARDLRSGMLVDPSGGQADVAAKLLRAVGDPATRFAEDRTRMLRALRFAAQLGFDIEPKTWEALREGMPHVDDLREGGERVVPYEMIAREFMKGFEADPFRTAELWETSGAFAVLAPELGTGVTARFKEGLARLEGREAPTAVRLACTLSYLGADGAETLVERLRLASAGSGATPGLVRRVIVGGDLALEKALGLKPLLSGADVMRILKIEAGPDVGAWLDRLLEAQLDGNVAGPEEAERWLRERASRA